METGGRKERRIMREEESGDEKETLDIPFPEVSADARGVVAGMSVQIMCPPPPPNS